MTYTYKYPRPAVTADSIVITKEAEPKVLLIQRGNPPFKGAWAFPGGFMNMDETTEECAIRELEEETSLKISGLHQIGAYSKVDRDPRGRTITVAYLAIIDAPVEVKGQDDAAKAAWFPISDLPHLAFDHFDIMQDAIKLYKSDSIQKMLQDAKAAELEKQRHQLYDPFYQRMNDQLYDVPTIEFTIVGIKQTCGEYSETIMKDIHAGSLLLLTPEPDNSYDKNAIAVYNEERKIGYVKATDTESIRPSVYDEGYTECYVVSKYKNSLVAECEEKEEDEDKDIDVDIPIIMPPEKPENDLESQEIYEMYKDFSPRFSNRLMEELVEASDDKSNIVISPSRLQLVLMLIANWTTPDMQRRILDVAGSEVMNMMEANILCDKKRLKVTPWNKEYTDTVPTIEPYTFLWLMKGLCINTETLNKAKEIFKVLEETVDFTLPTAKKIIDGAIEICSHGLIKGINDEINKDTLALITDILYFKARWEDAFEEEFTKERIFYGTNGKVKVPMMRQTGTMLYKETERCQMVQLPFLCRSNEDWQFSMRIYLPKHKYAIQDVLFEQWNSEFITDTFEAEVKLTLPKFEVTSDVKMKALLERIGLGDLFDSKDVIPQLAEMLKINDIVQQVKLKVDEKGTEAAVLTYVPIDAGGLPTEITEPFVMTVNRPFMFEIAEENSNTILFSGVINNIEK